MLLFMIWEWFSWFWYDPPGSVSPANTCKHLALPDSDAIAVESIAAADPVVLVTPSVVLSEILQEILRCNPHCYCILHLTLVVVDAILCTY